MPRTLPWLTGGASKKQSKASTSAPRQSKKRSSSPDRLVNSDLEDVDPPTRNGRTKKRRQREPSSSPPPASAPEVAYMREGLSADDIYVMVEDEFYSTAQLFTAPLHRAAYERLKRLHRSRGEKTLANLERATDGRTKAGMALRMKMEAEERAKKQKKRAGLEEDDDESDDNDEYMAVPQLAGLMTSSQSTQTRTGTEGVVKAKSNTRAAAGYLQSPNKGKRTKNVFVNEKAMPSVEEDDESTNDDDLDAGTTRTAVSYAYKHVDPALDKPRPSIEKPQESKTMGSGFFRQFAKSEQKKAEEPRSTLDSSPEMSRPSMSRESSSTPATNGVSRRSAGGKGSRMAEILARRRQATQALEDKPEPVTAYRPPPKEIKCEPFSPPKVDRRPHTNGNKSTNEEKSSGNVEERNSVRIKKEDKDKCKNTQRDDIPTFLF